MCACSLCKSCPNVMPQLLVEFGVDTNLFKLLYNRPLDDDLHFDNSDANNPDQCETHIRVVHYCIDNIIPFHKLHIIESNDCISVK